MKPLKLTFAFLAALVAFLPLPTLAQATSGTITLRRVPLESSLSSNTVRLFPYSPAIAQDTNHLWIGTAGGNVSLSATGGGGTLWYTGAGTPGAGLGTNADLYLDTATGNVYSRPGGTWGLIASIKGSTGAQGAVGTAGATGATGTAGAAGTAGATGAAGATGPNYPIKNGGTTLTAAPTSINFASGATVVGSDVTYTPPTIPTSLPPNGAAAGDLTGTYPAPTLTTSGVTGAAYSFGHSATYDAKGRATAATNPTGVGSTTTFLRGDGAWATPTGGGTVTSVGLTVPGLLYSVSGSPITGAGTFTETLITQTANTILAGPASGAAAIPTLRALVPLDIPASLAGTGLTSTAGVLSLSPTAVTAGSYTSTNLTVGADGRITAAASGSGGGGAPAGTDTQTLRYNGTALTATSNILTNTAGQTAFGGAIDTTSRVSVNPQGTGENGLSVTMPASATGNAIQIKNTGAALDNTITTSGKSLTLSETGDQYGTSSLTLENRNGVNGALFYSSLPLVDFIFNASGTQRNIRLECRGGTTGAPEFQINNNLFVGDNYVFAAKPFFVTNPASTVLTLQTASSQTAPFLQGKNSTATPLWQINANASAAFPAVLTAISTKTAAYTLTATDTTILVSGAFAMTLPTAAASLAGHSWTVKQIGAVSSTVVGTIDSATNYTLAGANNFVTIVTDGIAYYIVGKG